MLLILNKRIQYILSVGRDKEQKDLKIKLHNTLLPSRIDREERKEKKNQKFSMRGCIMLVMGKYTAFKQKNASMYSLNVRDQFSNAIITQIETGLYF